MRKLFLLLALFCINSIWSQTNYTTNFHDTKGNIDVNGSGSLQYTLPIALPPGIKSVAPQINLVYASGSANGVAGYGWNIAGISSISRTGKNIDKDGKVGGLNLNYSDYYSFNGQRLVKTSGQGTIYGGDGVEYATENYSNIKIKSIGSISGQDWSGPEYWEVTFEDGSQAWYGSIGNGVKTGSTPIEYNIVKWKDNQGNYITYNYLKENNVSLISSIAWGGNETLNKPHYNSIQFSYNTRTLYETSFIKGIEFKQTRLLNTVTVLHESSQFKKYQIIYHKKNINNNSSEISNYEKVKEIIEYNSNNENANPVSFESPALTTSVNETSFGEYSNVITTGDFNGDGLVDFIVKQPSQNGKPEGYYIYLDTYNSTNPSYLYLGDSSNFTNRSLVPFSIHPSDNIIKPRHGIVVVKNNGTGVPTQNSINVKYYSIKVDNTTINTLNNPLILEYNKDISANDLQFNASGYPTNNYPANYSGSSQYSVSAGAKEIDIDSDGISELIITINDHKSFNVGTSSNGAQSPCISIDPNGGGDCWVTRNLGYRYIVIDKEDLTNNTIHFTNYQATTNIIGQYILDLDNDGLQEIVSNSQGGSTNVTFKTRDVQNNIISQTVSTPVNNLKIYNLTKSQSGSYFINYSKTYTLKGKFEHAILGDLNGDKKVEILIPLHEDALNQPFWTGWSINLNKGNAFEESFQGLMTNAHDYTGSSIFYSVSAMVDIDQDGKTEIVNLNAHFSGNNNNTALFWGKAFSEAQYIASDPNFKWKFNERKFYQNTRPTAIATPIIGDFKIGNENPKILFLIKNTNDNSRSILSYNHFNVNENYNKIEQGGVNTLIEYKSIYDDNTNFYKPIKKEQYPYVELEESKVQNVVSQLKQGSGSSSTNYRTQKFLYRGLIINLHGKGMIGFRQVARSSWFAPSFENTMIWSGVEIDPLKDGLPIKEWTIRTSNNAQVFPADISVNSTQLLSFSSKSYQIDNWFNGQIVATPTQSQKPYIVKAIFPSSTVEKNFLTDTTTNSSVTYDNYYYPAQSIQNVNNGYAISTTDYQYQHNPSGVGNNYFLGRKTQEISIVQAYGDTKSVKEEYSYQNNLLKTSKTWNHNNSGYILETYNYDGFGNITEKIVSNSIDSASESVSSEYDPKGRFVIKKTDNLGLETNITYNNWGQVLTQTDPFGNTLTNAYDHWGKLLTSTSSLGGTSSYTYEKFSSNGIMGTKVSENLPDGDQNIVFTNTLGQTFKTVTKSFNQGKYTVTETAFDVLGRKIGEREPYEVTSITPAPSTVNSTTWNRIYYDDSVFPAKVTATAFSNGKSVQTSISGNTASIKELNGYGRTTSKTTDALGNIISSTDAGGTVTFSYNALGQNISANYQGNVVTTNYDIWGRKANFHDPANGTYEYKYDGLGKTKKIISPKGEKNYVYNANGLLASVNELSNDGTSTTKQITLNYNNFGQLTNKNGTSNNRYFEHNYTYYPDGRLESDAETFEGKIFYTQNIVYDNLGRIQTYDKGIESNGVTTETSITHNYKTWDGSLYQMSGPFNGTGKPVLWSLGTTNAKGQVLSGTLGKARVNNTYDTYGFLTNTDHWFWPPALVGQPSNSFVNINYSFDAVKNELNSRTYNAVFGISETFEYDNNNRLINWTNPLTGQMTYNEYDIAGRITQNGQVGDIEFGGGNSSYQATGAQLNPEGEQHYDMYGVSKLLQMISYNENNDPIRIDGTEFDYEFGYGLSHSRQIMYYGGYGDGNFDGHDAAKFTKYYSEANDFEILVNNETGQEKHIIYIGGSPYESEIIYIKNFESDEGQFNFLHKDYLGSILAITDFEENVLEQRHYDAWGNFTHLKVNGQDFVGAELKDYLKGITQEQGGLIVDRGYTSHEHLHGVELIHMNGRLYDPMLKRFLNADENIQDPYNTQNYNKYGYVMNNPLMYNDPSGEFWVAGFFLTFLAYAIPAAVIGAAIGAGFYLFQSFLTNSWSWGGFFKSILTGAATGFISGGLGQVFSAAGFFATVGNGALAGAGAGGVTSLFNGTSFLEGVGKGALIGGAVGALSWGINKLFTNPNGNQPVSEIKKDDLSNVNLATDDPQKYAYSTMKEFEKGYGGLGNYGVEHYYLDAPPGYGVAKDGSFYKMGFFKRNFGWGSAPDSSDIYGLTVGSDIYIPKAAFGSKALLAEVITHETGHVILNNSSMSALAYTSTNFKNHSRILDNWGHVSIRKMSLELATKNPWMQSVDWINKILNNNGTQFMRYLNSSKSQLDKLLQPLIKSFSY